MSAKYFEGKDISAFSRFYGRSRLVITFSQYSARPPAAIFAGGFLQKNRISHIGIQARANHWWHSAEVAQALRMQADEIRRHDHLVTYGASMGAHGALAYSAMLDADTVIAVAPQFSIFRDEMPGETRWQAEAGRIRRIPRDMTTMVSRRAAKFLIYDPFFAPDLAQVRRFRDLPNSHHLRLALAGHMPLQRMLAAGSLSTMTLALMRPDPDIAEIRRLIRDSRTRVPNYCLALALRRYSRPSPMTALGLARRWDRDAIAANWEASFLMAQICARARQRDEALAHLRQSLVLRPTLRPLRLARLLLAADGGDDRFAGFVDDLVARNPRAEPAVRALLTQI